MGKLFSKNFELTEEKIKELLSKTRFNRDEIQHWSEVFKKEFPKGYISKAQFVDMFSKSNEKLSKFCGYFFDAFDVDNNGDLDFEEFLCALSVTRADTLDKLRVAFRICDTNKSGQIDAGEMTKIVTAVLEKDAAAAREIGSPEKIAKEIILRFDVNGDRQITEDEFVEGCLRHQEFKRLFLLFCS